jgi:hypothetical protein
MVSRRLSGNGTGTAGPALLEGNKGPPTASRVDRRLAASSRKPPHRPSGDAGATNARAPEGSPSTPARTRRALEMFRGRYRRTLRRNFPSWVSISPPVVSLTRAAEAVAAGAAERLEVDRGRGRRLRRWQRLHSLRRAGRRRPNLAASRWARSVADRHEKAALVSAEVTRHPGDQRRQVV